MASSRRPRMSLPPELSAIDEAWGDEEQTTLPRPSRTPTAPIRPEIPEVIIPAPLVPTDIELEPIDDDFQERATTVPRVPLDEYARRMMMSREMQQAVTEAPPAPSRDAPDFHASLEFDLGLHDLGLRDLAMPPRQPGPLAPSQFPTAPPPINFDDERSRTLPGSHLRDDMELDLSSELPPPLSYATLRAHAEAQQRTDHQTMKDRFAMGDFSGALEMAEYILGRTPHDPEAKSLSEKCRDVLLDMYSSRIAGLDRVPRIAMTHDQIRWLSLDHRAGFLLSMVDGISSIDDLLDISGMQRLDALRIICALLDQKVIILH
jgi:hypothetical protein